MARRQPPKSPVSPPPQRAITPRMTPRQKQIAYPSATPDLKTTGVTHHDAIRVLATPGSGLFRDGMSVGDFLRGVPSRQHALQLLARCRKAGTIGFEHRDPPEVAAP